MQYPLILRSKYKMYQRYHKIPIRMSRYLDTSPAESPSDSGSSASVMEAVPEVFEAGGRFELNRRFLRTGLESLDSVDLHVVFRTRALVMKSVLFFC